MFSSSRERHPFFLTLAGVAAIFLAVFIFRGALERGVSFFGRPFVAVGTWAHRQVRGWTDADRCSLSKLEEIDKERIALAVDYATFDRLRLENEDLKKRLSFAEQKGFRLVSAHIIGRTASEEARTFLIDRGAADGIKVGQAAMIENGVMVGKVISATAATATIGSLTDPMTSTAAAVLNADRTVGITRGLSGTLIRLEFVPHSEKLDVNNVLITSGLESGVPTGLLIGTVNSVISDKAEPFQKAIVEPFADMRHHDSVSLITGFAL